MRYPEHSDELGTVIDSKDNARKQQKKGRRGLQSHSRTAIETDPRGRIKGKKEFVREKTTKDCPVVEEEEWDAAPTPGGVLLRFNSARKHAKGSFVNTTQPGSFGTDCGGVQCL